MLNPIIEARIYTAFAAPFTVDEERQGVATALFTATYRAARENGFEKLCFEKLITHVRADNPVALATYARQGFAVVGTARRHAKIDGRYIDEVFIEKPLDPDQS
jgi:RimJ/RimL family protein N-acetyltransferase